jgi:uncharacterized membrane protein
VAALALLAYLATTLYNRAIAIGTIATLLLLSGHPQLQPLIQGRQVLAELPMFVYLLTGYAFLLLSLRRHPMFIIAACLCWGIARLSKGQAAPFWLVSLLVPFATALLLRQWRIATIFGIGLGGSFLASAGWQLLVAMLLTGRSLPAASLPGLYEVTAIVLQPMNRLYALNIGITFGLLTLLGLLVATWRLWQQRSEHMQRPELGALHLSLLSLTGSWFAWYLLLSVGVPRYLFPVTFFGSIFVAALLHQLTNGFNMAYTLQQTNNLIKRRVNRQSLGAAAALFLIVMAGALTALTWQRYYFTYSDDSAVRVATFFNTQTPANTRIETYESELHFLLNRAYHYPPDQVHVELNRRGLLGQETPIDYDPLSANPDYLVVGEFSRGNQLYEPVIQSGAFRLMQQIGGYDIYERVR